MRELEGAIGYDCRRLEDGRKAVFRHTWIHRKARREILERRDLIAVLQTSLCSVSALSSHYRLKIDSVVDFIEKRRIDMVRAVFPYVRVEDSKPSESTIKGQTIDELFDELDEIIANDKKNEQGTSENGAGQIDEVEPDGGKLV